MGVFGPQEMLIQLFHPDFGLLVGFGGRRRLVRGCCRLGWRPGWKRLLLLECCAWELDRWVLLVHGVSRDGRRAGPTCCGGARPIRLSATCARMLRCPYRNMLKGKAFNNLVGSYRHNGLLDEPTRRIWSLQGGCWPGGENWRRLLAQGGHRAWLLPGQRCRYRSPTTLV